MAQSDGYKDPRIKYKYITICEGSVRVKIERGGEPHLRHFPIRGYPTLGHAMGAAVEWRDSEHLRLYGIPVLEKVHQLSRRGAVTEHKHPDTDELLPDLPPGLAYGYHRGRLLYVVASFQVESKPKRQRFSIKAHGVIQAIELARKCRLDALESAG
jgi:hypothetical protein